MKKNVVVSLGEGNTPLLRLANLSRELNCDLWAKCEFINPTGSFKDRGSVTEILEAIRQEKNGVVCASTGNMAASLSAYAAQANLECIVVVPKKTPESKLRQALICGARLEKVIGTYDDCVAVAKNIANTKNYYLCGDYEVRRIGQRSIGWELAKSKINFAAVVVPVGNGTVGIAIMEGLLEKKGLQQLPQFIGIQAETANPIEIAWKENKKIIFQRNTQTVASAFNVGSPLDGDLVLEWLQKSNGSMLSVNDSEIIQAQNILAQKEGLFVETTAASTLASVLKNPRLFRDKRIVLVLTGSGLKE